MGGLMNMVLRAFALLIAVLILSGCATTANPIGISGGAQTDVRLIGGWKVVAAADLKDDKEAYVFFLPRKEGGLQAIVVGWNPKEISNPNESGLETYEVVTGKVGDLTIINARRPPNGEVSNASSGYSQLLYRFEADGSLQVSVLSSDWDGAVADAIRSGRIAGTLPKYGAGHATADPQSLDAFFAQVVPMLSAEPAATLRPLN